MLDIGAGVADSEEGQLHAEVDHIAEGVDLGVHCHNAESIHLISSAITRVPEKVTSLEWCCHQWVGRGAVAKVSTLLPRIGMPILDQGAHKIPGPA